jgi:hypothetical protein
MFIVVTSDAIVIKWSKNDPFPGCLINNISSIVELQVDETELTLVKDMFWSYSKPMINKFTMAHPICSIPMPYGSVAVWYGDFARTICANLLKLDKPDKVNGNSPSSKTNRQDVVSFKITTNQDVIDICINHQQGLPASHHGHGIRIGRIAKALPFREKHTCWLFIPIDGIDYDVLELQQISKKLDELNDIAWKEKNG